MAMAMVVALLKMTARLVRMGLKVGMAAAI